MKAAWPRLAVLLPCLLAMTTRILPLALMLAATTSARAQNPAVITLTESPDCDCRIELTRVISLSDSLHPGLFAYSPLVMRDSRGNWYATSNTDGLKQVGVFDQDGRLKKVPPTRWRVRDLNRRIGGTGDRSTGSSPGQSHHGGRNRRNRT